MKADRMDTDTHDYRESECDDGESRCDDGGSGSDDGESECDDRESELLSRLSCSHSLPVVVVTLPVVTTQQYWRAPEAFHCRWELGLWGALRHAGVAHSRRWHIRQKSRRRPV